MTEQHTYRWVIQIGEPCSLIELPGQTLRLVRLPNIRASINIAVLAPPWLLRGDVAGRIAMQDGKPGTVAEFSRELIPGEVVLVEVNIYGQCPELFFDGVPNADAYDDGHAV